jgi:hypothetical protein
MQRWARRTDQKRRLASEGCLASLEPLLWHCHDIARDERGNIVSHLLRGQGKHRSTRAGRAIRRRSFSLEGLLRDHPAT